MIYLNTIKGAIFCQVIKSKLFIQDNPSITPGNQKWNGAAPLFNNKAEVIIIDTIHKFKFNWKIILLNKNIIKIENNKTEEARACVKKYFKDASVDINLLLSIIKGIIDNRLISSPIHTPNHELDEILIKVPKINVSKKRIFAVLFNIKKKRIRTFISGVWAQ